MRLRFLLYARESGIDVFAAQGSYAGAFGIPQFMPGSYRRFAVDYDGDGRRDLNSSPIDAIGSVANFLRAHGWEAGRPIAAPAQVSGDPHQIFTRIYCEASRHELLLAYSCKTRYFCPSRHQKRKIARGRL